MPIHTVNCTNIPCEIFINDDTLTVAFNFLSKSTFIDSHKDIPTAIWQHKGLKIDDKLCVYNMFVKPEGALKDYLREIIQCDGQVRMPYEFGF